MKNLPFVLVVVMASVASVHSQDAPIVVPREPATPVSAPTTARIIGDIPDGTPAAPTPAKPQFIISKKDVLDSISHEQGGRTITIQRVKPIALPPPPAPPPVAPVIKNAAFLQRLAHYSASHPKSDTICLGATVYRFNYAPPRTLVKYWPEGSGECVTFWSSADFALISGIGTFVATDGGTRSLFMTWSSQNVDRLAAMFAGHGRNYGGPDIPDFPDGPATFSIVGTPPAPEILVPIQSLHDLYNSEHARLQTAWEGRERARIEREAYLKAHPPQPKDIVINFWRTEKAAPVEGGGK